MRVARGFLVCAVATLVAVWTAGVGSVRFGGPREEDLGAGVLWVAGFAGGHFVALALSITAVGLAARALVSAPRRVSGYVTLAAGSVLAAGTGWYLSFLFGW